VNSFSIFARLVTAFCFPSFLLAQIHVGQSAPALRLGNLVQGQLASGSQRMPTVLEFWATWCGPCVANIPHLNELVRQFEGRGVQFVSVTAEDAGTVQEFLKKHPILGVVGLDPEKTVIKAYSAGIPSAVLIDRHNRVVRKVHPARITSATVEALLSDRPVDIPVIRDDMLPAQHGGPFTESENDASSVVRLSIAPADQPGGLAVVRDPGTNIDYHLKSTGTNLTDLISFAYAIPAERVLISRYLLGGYYAVDAWVPADSDESSLRVMLQIALKTAAQYDAKLTNKELDVLVLRGLPGKLQKATATLPSGKCEKGLCTGNGLRIDAFLGQLQKISGKPVVSDYPSAGNYQWQLRWDTTAAGALERALSDQLGLQLVSERRRLVLLHIEPSTPVR
jgi:uncharacterized protein (TIGR03435 family)